MLLTAEQLQEIRQIIEDYHNAFIANVIDSKLVDPDILQKLRDKGLLDVPVESIKDAYIYGQLLAQMENPATAMMSYEQFRDFIKRNPVPLTPVEHHAIMMAQQQAGQYCKGLGNRVNVLTGQALINADAALRVKLLTDIRTNTAETIARRESLQKLASNLGWATGDWARDWKRIANTEIQQAMNTAVADKYKKKYGAEVRVARVPHADACDRCKDLFLGSDGKPKIFVLSDLEANGTNVGRKAKDWLPVVGVAHPHCFAGDTLITTAEGPRQIQDVRPGDSVLSHDGKWHPVTHTWESEYAGELLKFEGKGWNVETTPDHPLLSGGNWLPAKAIHNGENLVGLVDQVLLGDLPGLLPVDTNAKQFPPVSGERSFFVSILSLLSGTGMPVTAIDFDGQFYIREGQIDQATVKQEPRNGGQADRAEDAIDVAFVGRAKFESVNPQAGQDEPFRLLFTPDSCMKSSNVSLAFVRASATIADQLRVLHSAWRYSGFDQTSANSTARNPEVFGYRLLREQLVRVHMNDLGDIEFNPCRHYVVPPTQGVFDALRIVNVSSRKFAGKVFNLTVAESNSYIANGIVAHNCQCQTIRIPAGWGFNAAGDLVPGGTYGQLAKGDFRQALRAEEELHKSLCDCCGTTIEYQGIPVKIENQKGSTRQWKDADGNKGQTLMLCAYGEIVGTRGGDAEPIDVYVGSDPSAPNVFIVHQQDPENGLIDEDKAMLGFSSAEFALEVYRAHFDKPGHDVTVSTMAIPEFRRWCESSIPLPGDEVGEDDQPILVVEQDKEPHSDPKLVVLEKSNEDLPAYIGAANGMAGDRNPGRGTAPNFLMNTPRGIVPPTDTTVFDAMIEDEHRDQEMEAARKRRRRNKHSWDVTEPAPDHIFTIEMPEGRAYEDLRDGLAEERQATIKQFELDNGGLLNEDHQIIRKAGGPYIGPRGGKWSDPEMTIPWKAPGTSQRQLGLFDRPAPKKETAVESKPEAPKKYRYAVPLRPISHANVPKGWVDKEEHPRFKHGVAVYDRPLTSDEIESYELEPMLEPKDVKDRIQSVAQKMGEDYAQEYVDLAEEDPVNFNATVRQAWTRTGPGHTTIEDIGEVEKEVLAELKRMAGGGKVEKKPEPASGLDEPTEEKKNPEVVKPVAAPVEEVKPPAPPKPGSWEIAEIEDTREYDWGSGKPIPGSGVGATCERCKKKHDILYHMREKETGKAKTVGSGCGPAMVGGKEAIDSKSVSRAKKAAEGARRQKFRAKIEAWGDELDPKAKAVEIPEELKFKWIQKFNASALVVEGHEDVFQVEHAIVKDTPWVMDPLKLSLWEGLFRKKCNEIVEDAKIPSRLEAGKDIYQPASKVRDRLIQAMTRKAYATNATYRALANKVRGPDWSRRMEEPELKKAQGPFYGPKGGLWADPEHTIPWKAPTGARKPVAKPEGPGGGQGPGRRSSTPQKRKSSKKVREVTPSLDTYTDEALFSKIAELVGENHGGAIGLRGLSPEDDLGPLRPSRVWEDNTPTDETLEGTSAVVVSPDWGMGSKEQALSNIAKYREDLKSYGSGGRIGLVIGESAKGGEDIGEIVIPDAKLIYVFGEESPKQQQTSLIPSDFQALSREEHNLPELQKLAKKQESAMSKYVREAASAKNPRDRYQAWAQAEEVTKNLLDLVVELKDGDLDKQEFLKRTAEHYRTLKLAAHAEYQKTGGAK